MILGQTGCGKTTFIQNITKNKLFGKINDVQWISKIYLSKKRMENIKTCFDDEVKFSYPQNVPELDYLIENFQRIKTDDNENSDLMGDINKHERVIIMDDVSGLADKYDNFVSFLISG